jgi:hypothetical protein
VGLFPRPYFAQSHVPALSAAWLFAKLIFIIRRNTAIAVFRVERTQNYTVMSNYHLWDKRLSLKAKGLLSQMLSLPEDWDYTLSGLAQINAEGKDAIRAAVVELERAGYIQRRQRIDKAGKFSDNEYIIREYPISAPVPQEGLLSAFSSSGNPTTENPSTDLTPTDFSTQQNIELKNEEKNKKTDLRSKESFPIPSAPFPDGTAAEEPKGRDSKRGRCCAVKKSEMDAYRELIGENIRYDDFVRERPWDDAQLDEMVELMVEAVCSKRETLRVAGNELPQAVVKSRLLKLDDRHIRFVFDCLHHNTTQVRNIKQYLLTTLYNAPITMENYYAAQVNHDLYGNAA